jgi:hypothetical protein
VPVGHEVVHTGGRDRDAVLVVLDLGGDADPHDVSWTVRGRGVRAATSIRLNFLMFPRGIAVYRFVTLRL